MISPFNLVTMRSASASIRAAAVPLLHPLPSGLLASHISTRYNNLPDHAPDVSKLRTALANQPDRPRLSGLRSAEGNNNSPSAELHVAKIELLLLPYSYPINIQRHAGYGHAGQIASFPVFSLLHAKNEEEVLAVKDGRRTF